MNKKKSWLVSAALAGGALSIACGASSQQAVAEPNGEATLSYNYLANELTGVDLIGTDINIAMLAVRGQLNLPIGRFIGASLFADLGRTKQDFDSSGSVYYPPLSFSCTATQWTAGASVFVRDPVIGRIRGNYLTGRVPSCGYSSSLGEVENAYTSGSYGLDAEYYFERWTMGASYGREWNEDFGQRFGVNQYGVNVLFYPIDELRIGGTYIHVENPVDGDRYGASIEYQPISLGNRFSFGFGYERRTRDYEDANVYRVTLNYLFGTQPELLKRDRFYR